MKLHCFCQLAGLVLALLCLQSGIRAAGDSAAPGAAGTSPPPEPPTQGAPGPTQPANPSPAPDTAPAPSAVKPDGAAGSNGANPDGAGAPSGAKPDAVSRQPQVPTEPPKPAAQATSPFKIGAEVFTGGSNVQGHRFLDDGFWAGSAPFLPSVGYVRYDDGKGHAAKAAIGLGDLFRGKDKVWDQPAEAWWQFPAGKLSMTVGQYWVPFAAQEWEYENKPGVMVQWSRGAYGLSVSANENLHTDRPNAYMRVSRSLGKDNVVGLSLGAGKGLSFNSEHNRGWGLDGTYGWRGWRFNTEFVQLQAPGSRNFRFIWTKLGYEKLGPWKPYISWYNWDDRAQQLGHFQSTLVGLSYRVNSRLAIEGAVADTLRKNVGWAQLHWTWEK